MSCGVRFKCPTSTDSGKVRKSNLRGRAAGPGGAGGSESVAVTAAVQELSIRGYAEHRARRGLKGGTKAAVEKALASARIPRTKSGKIDPVAADAAWEANTTPRPLPATDLEAASTAGPPPRPGRASEEDLSDYQRNRAEREYFLRKSAELEYAEEARLLVRVEQVKAEYFRICRVARSTLEAVPAQAAPQLVGMTDVAEIQRVLREEIRTALASLADV